MWLNAGAMRLRVNLALRVANGEMASIPLASWPEWATLSAAAFNQQRDGVIRALLGGYADRRRKKSRSMLDFVRRSTTRFRRAQL
jgi:hypothetical protein